MFNLGIALGWLSGEETILKAARVIRVSTAEQAESGRSGLDRQRQETDRIARSKNYRVVRTFEISDVSGTTFFLSPEGRELLELVETRVIDVVVVSEMSRLIRPDDLSSFGFLDIFKRNGVSIDAGGSVHDLASAEGFLGGGVLALLSGWERMTHLRKMMQSKESARRAGLCPSSPNTLPLGVSYDRSTKQFRYNDEIWRIQEAFRLVDVDGIRNYSEVGRRVGIKAPTLRNLLRNKAYIGIREYSQVRDQSKKTIKPDGRQGSRPKINRTPDSMIRVRIFSEDGQAVCDERFERVQAAISEISARHARVAEGKRIGNLGSGLLYCACGERIYTTTSSNRKGAAAGKSRGYYICRSKHYVFRERLGGSCCQPWVPKARMDQLLEAFAMEFLNGQGFVEAVVTHARAKEGPCGDPPASRAVSLQRKRDDILRRDSRLIDAFEAGAITIEEMKRRRFRLEIEREALVDQIESSGEDGSVAKKNDFTAILNKGHDAWAFLKSHSEKKNFLARLFAKIEVQGETIRGFQLAAGLVPNSHPTWGAAVGNVVSLSQPFQVAWQMPPATDGERHCRKCQQCLPMSAFYATERSSCIDCIREYNRKSYKARKKNK